MSSIKTGLIKRTFNAGTTFKLAPLSDYKVRTRLRFFSLFRCWTYLIYCVKRPFQRRVNKARTPVDKMHAGIRNSV